MKISVVNNIKKLCSKGLFAVLLLTGFFIFNPATASSHQRFAAQTTEYVTSGAYLATGFNYPALVHLTYKRPSINAPLFSRTNFRLFNNKQTTIKIKLALQTVLTKPVYSSFYFIKSIPQNGKNDLPAILA